MVPKAAPSQGMKDIPGPAPPVALPFCSQDFEHLPKTLPELTGDHLNYTLILPIPAHFACRTGDTAMRVVVSAVIFAATLVSAGAQAQSAQTSDDIVKFFASAANLGASRGICVGTEDECRSKSEAPVKTGLDMLINFNLDSADLTEEARAKLSEFAKALKDNRLKSHSFIVEGYTDASGSATYNVGLSQRRAQSVTAFLLSNGVEPSRIKALGKGESDPRVSDPYDPVNRRVEMRIKIQ